MTHVHCGFQLNHARKNRRGTSKFRSSETIQSYARLLLPKVQELEKEKLECAMETCDSHAFWDCKHCDTYNLEGLPGDGGLPKRVVWHHITTRRVHSTPPAVPC